MSKTSLYDLFSFGDALGSGAFATVFLVTEKATNTKFAMKVIDKKKCKGKETLIVKEVSLSKNLVHKNIVRMFNCFESKEKVYLQLEYLEGGELFDRIVSQGYYDETHAQKVVQNLLEAVNYLHAQNIIHRDIKPENLLLVSKDNLEDIKLTDFGFSTSVDPEEMLLKTNCGTLMYMAPEILKAEKYGKHVDMWSVGVITYILLSGYPPFWNEDETKIMELITNAKFEFFSPNWDDVSKEAKDFISSLIKVNQNTRLTAKKALAHPWLHMKSVPKVDLSAKVASNLTKHFDAKKHLKRAISVVRTMIALSRHGSKAGSRVGSSKSLAGDGEDKDEMTEFLTGLKVTRRVTLTASGLGALPTGTPVTAATTSQELAAKFDKLTAAE